MAPPTFSYPKLYFGVELELSVAWLYPNEPLINPTEKRPRNIVPSQEILDAVSKTERRGAWTLAHLDNHAPMGEFARLRTMKFATWQSIRRTIAAAGLPIEVRPDEECKMSTSGSTSFWKLVDDISIMRPISDAYHWTSLEIVSPAYEFTPENIEAVQKMCDAMSTDYLTHNSPDSTGVHVHVSFGVHKKWSFESIKRALMFFWSFHTQFDTLHPRERHDQHWAKSMRVRSNMVTQYILKRRRRPTPLEGLLEIEAKMNMEDLLEAVCARGPDRLMAYNVVPIFQTMRPDMSGHHTKTTLEFREHEGTVNGERVTHWIKLLCNVIIFLEMCGQAVW